MAKKQPITPASATTKSPRSASNQKVSNTNSGIQLSNKVLIPAIIAFFLALAFLYNMPLMQGMKLSAHDSTQYIALNKESADYKAATGHAAMWSSRMFSGMPAFLMGGYDFPKAIEYAPRTILAKYFLKSLHRH